jgi:hypothetical protein
MPTRKFLVTLEDGRTVKVCAPDEAGARKQANHHEKTRVVIANRRGLPEGPEMAMAVSAVCLEL